MRVTMFLVECDLKNGNLWNDTGSLVVFPCFTKYPEDLSLC